MRNPSGDIIGSQRTITPGKQGTGDTVLRRQLLGTHALMHHNCNPLSLVTVVILTVQ